MSKKEAVQSHIQIPKVVLRRFENEYGKIYNYDVKKGFVGKNGTAKSLNTEYGYYTLEDEKFLNKNIEQPLERALNEIDNVIGKPLFNLSNDAHQCIMNYVYSLISRDPDMLKEMQKDSVSMQFFPERIQRGMAVKQGLYTASEKNLFSEYGLTFAINRTRIPFVLPNSGMCAFSMEGRAHIHIPISPFVAVTLVEDIGKSILLEGNRCSLYEYLSDDVVRHINEFAFNYQCKKRWGYVMSQSGEELKRLSSIINE